MTQRWCSALVVSLLILGPLAAHGQSPGRAEGDPWSRRGPVAVLMEERETLALTAEQVTRLEAVRHRMEEQNRPLVEQLVQIREKWRDERPSDWRELTPGERREARQRFQRGVREETRPLMAAIRRNNREAMGAVRAVLTEEQRQKVRELVRARQGDGMRQP